MPFKALFKVIIFGLVYFYGIFLMFRSADWFWDQKLMWSRGISQSSDIWLDIYYSLQLGYHGHRAIYQFFEHKRRDFWAMFIHHLGYSHVINRIMDAWNATNRCNGSFMQ